MGKWPQKVTETFKVHVVLPSLWPRKVTVTFSMGFLTKYMTRKGHMYSIGRFDVVYDGNN